jgi:hypothetical protein
VSQREGGVISHRVIGGGGGGGWVAARYMTGQGRDGATIKCWGHWRKLLKKF